ncbi:chromosome segregation protein SMC [candidate division KSB1 bacterium]|nr:chromosome segregation protein SMC [candidate division KSB1 bacterium]RQW04137.1 MAG: chromosome segregation protein SMC [candidate division KSB1 bacterium]
MRLAELNIVGFKSFAKKTNIIFDEGMTAIVGPNGCGKSNIVDAIRWVMGEQRSSVLRGEKMDNVIFSGSTSAKPVGMAEVSLKIENSDNALPVDYAEVMVTRRLFRSGESHYLLNGNQVRLKDIMDLFMDTGLTSQTYSVIELAQVEKILNGEPEERRKIFEEAAGITKFKQRRKLTFRKLEATEKDLVRVEDIMSEVEKTVRGLKRQVSKAQRYQTLAEELKELEIKLATIDYTNILTELEPLQTRLELSVNDREATSATLAKHDAAYEELRRRLLELERNLSQEQGRYNEQTRAVQKFEERVLVNSERIRSLKEMQERYISERTGLIDRLSELETALDQANDTAKTARQQLEDAKDDYQRTLAKFEEFRKKFEAKRAEVKNIETELLFYRDELSKKQNEGERLRATEENLGQRLEQIENEIQNYQNRSYDLAEKLINARVNEKERAASLGTLQHQMQNAAHKLQEIKAALERLTKADLQDRNRIEVLENNAAMLRKVLENYQDYPTGVRFLATHPSENIASEGTVANVLHVQQQHRVAISSALGEAATFLIVKDVSSAHTGIGLLQQDKKGIVSFLPLDSVVNESKPRPDVDDLGIIGWADDLIRCDDRYKAVINALLQDYLVVQDIETANRIFKTLQRHHVNIVTLSGEVLGHWGLVRGGSPNRRQSDIVGRQEELEQLTREIHSLHENSQRRQEQMNRRQEEEQDWQNKITDFSARIREMEKELGDQRVELGRLIYEEQSIREAMEHEEGERAQLLERVSQLDQNLKSQDSHTQTLLDKRSELTQLLYNQQEELGTLEGEQNQIAARVQTLQVNVATYQGAADAAQREYDSVRDQIYQIKRMIESRDEESGRASKEIIDLEEVNSEYNERIVDSNKHLATLAEQIDKLKDEQYQTNVKTDEQEKLIRSLRNENQSLSESVHSIELRVSELKMRLQSLVDRTREEYDYQLKRDYAPVDIDVDDSRSRVDEIKERLKSIGPVNLLALKEYEQEKERFDFLDSQRADLLKARGNLIETIDIINKTAREKFLETFENVQKNFVNVFRSFFEGGRASLVLREGNDPLEADIDIYAAPAGKKPTSLQLLSGGEKSLTAVSLLFAIYLVKPSPFCIFDEVDAPLDDKNVQRFASALQEYAQQTQFIVVTHNKLTMRAADQLYGVTMQEEGVSKVVSVKFEAAQQFAA